LDFQRHFICEKRQTTQVRGNTPTHVVSGLAPREASSLTTGIGAEAWISSAISLERSGNQLTFCGNTPTHVVSGLAPREASSLTTGIGAEAWISSAISLREAAINSGSVATHQPMW